MLTISYQVWNQSENAAILENKENKTEYSSANTGTSAENVEFSTGASAEIEMQKKNTAPASGSE